MCLNETDSKIGQENMSDTFPIQNGPQQDNTLSQLPFNFALEYAIKNVKVTRKDKLNGAHCRPMLMLIYSEVT